MSVVAVAFAMLAACVSEPESVDSTVSHPQITQAPTAWFEPSTVAQQATLREGRAAKRFAAMNPGTWEIDFDPVLETARSVRGSGERVGDPVAFATQHADLFGATELVLDGTVVSGDITQVSLSQQHRGVPVIGGQLGMSIAQGRLVLVQGTTYPIDDELDVEPGIDADAAIAAAETALETRIDAAARLAILPERHVGSVTYRLVWEVATHDNVRVQIDASSGEVVAAYDSDRYGYLGSVWSTVDERTVGSPIISVPNPYNNVTVSGFAETGTDANGNFAINTNETGMRTITSSLRGAHATVVNLSGSGSYSGTVIPSQPAAVTWGSMNSSLEERDAFRAVNVTNRFLATVFPSVPWIENVPVTVNVNAHHTCNAWWDGTKINTSWEGGGCNNAGRIFDVVAHEWGHALDENLPGGTQDAALAEFIGDLVVFTQTDDPIVGPGFFQDGRPIRDLNESFYQCYDANYTEIHQAGQFLGAIVWDIHEDLERAGVTGLPLARRMLLPIASAQTRAQWYGAMLVADDNDGSLSNGTPNECLIYRQFAAHSCNGTRFPGMPAAPPVGCDAPPVPSLTTTTIAANANPAAVGQQVVFTVNVSATTAPTGYINLSVDGWNVQYALVSPVNATTSRATFTFPTMAQGSHTVVGSFAPTGSYLASSAAMTQTVFCAFTGATASPSVLSTGAWGSFVPVQIGVTTACDAPRLCAISDVTMNESDLKPLGDWTITSALGISLRRERWSFGTGRLYDVEVTCNDGIVAPSTLHAFVSVPR